MSSLPRLIALPSLNESSPLAHLMTPEVLRRLGLTTHRSATVAQVSDSGNPHEINIPLSVQASAIKYSVLQDGMSDSLPNAIVVSSWEIALLSPQCQSVTYQILRAIRDSGVPVYLINSSPHFTLDPLTNLSETLFTGVQITQIPAYETSLVESKSGELLGLPRDSIKVLDVVELRRLFLRWRTLRDQIPDIQNTPHTYISDTWAPSVADRIDSTSPLLNGSPAHLATIITQVSEIELTPAPTTALDPSENSATLGMCASQVRGPLESISPKTGPHFTRTPAPAGSSMDSKPIPYSRILCRIPQRS